VPVIFETVRSPQEIAFSGLPSTHAKDRECRLSKTKGALMILEEIQHHLDRIEAAQKRCEEQPTDVATIVVLLSALAMAVKDLLREAMP
jgi:hypothetical protein